MRSNGASPSGTFGPAGYGNAPPSPRPLAPAPRSCRKSLPKGLQPQALRREAPVPHAPAAADGEHCGVARGESLRATTSRAVWRGRLRLSCRLWFARICLDVLAKFKNAGGGHFLALLPDRVTRIRPIAAVLVGGPITPPLLKGTIDGHSVQQYPGTFVTCSSIASCPANVTKPG